MYPYSDTDSNSDRSYASGDPRAYYWLHTDYEQGQSSRRNRDEHDDVQSDRRDPQDVEKDNALWVMYHDEVRDLRAQVWGLLAQDARNALVASNTELQETKAYNVNLATRLVGSEANNEHLVQRVVELCAFMCGLWVEHAGEQLRARRLSHLNRVQGWIILVLLTVNVPLVSMP